MRDPVSEPIRPEKNGDAAPSAREVRKKHRERMANQGCEVCGHSNPGELTEVQYKIHRTCPKSPDPDQTFEQVVLCDEHVRSPSTLKRAHQVQYARKNGGDWMVLYNCGRVLSRQGEHPNPSLARQGPNPPVACDGLYRTCGETIQEIVRVR